MSHHSEFSVIEPWISDRSSVLDLGCGDGSLLQQLSNDKQVQGYGLEIDPKNIQSCLAKGINVVEHDLDQGIEHIQDTSFDYVLMTQALQTVRYPDKLLDEMLRIGRKGIVTFPNFAHMSCRVHLLCKGTMPVTKQLPYTWYNTPNIHLCTFKDFELLCQARSIKILDRLVLYNKQQRWFSDFIPNLFGHTAIYLISN